MRFYVCAVALLVVTFQGRGVVAAPFPVNGSYAFKGCPPFYQGAFVNWNVSSVPTVVMAWNCDIGDVSYSDQGKFITRNVNVTSYECVSDNIIRTTTSSRYGLTNTTVVEGCSLAYMNETHWIVATGSKAEGTCPDESVLKEITGFVPHTTIPSRVLHNVFSRVDGVIPAPLVLKCSNQTTLPEASVPVTEPSSVPLRNGNPATLSQQGGPATDSGVFKSLGTMSIDTQASGYMGVYIAIDTVLDPGETWPLAFFTGSYQSHQCLNSSAYVAVLQESEIFLNGTVIDSLGCQVGVREKLANGTEILHVRYLREDCTVSVAQGPSGVDDVTFDLELVRPLPGNPSTQCTTSPPSPSPPTPIPSPAPPSSGRAVMGAMTALYGSLVSVSVVMLMA